MQDAVALCGLPLDLGPTNSSAQHCRAIGTKPNISRGIGSLASTKACGTELVRRAQRAPTPARRDALHANALEGRSLRWKNRLSDSDGHEASQKPPPTFPCVLVLRCWPGRPCPGPRHQRMAGRRCVGKTGFQDAPVLHGCRKRRHQQWITRAICRSRDRLQTWIEVECKVWCA